MLPETIEIDAYSPRQIAERVERAGADKVRLPALQTVTLGVLAGAFVAFGAMYHTLAVTDPASASAPRACWAGSRSPWASSSSSSPGPSCSPATP